MLKPLGDIEISPCHVLSVSSPQNTGNYFWYSCDRASLVWFFDWNQQDATIFDYLFLKGSTCFGRFLRPSLEAHNCTFICRFCQPMLLLVGVVDEMELSSFSSVPSHPFHLTSSISPVPSHQFHLTSSILSVPSHQFHPISSFSPVPSHQFHLTRSISSVPSHQFHLISSISLVPSH